MGRLSGKRVIITGAASGIGKASALLFAREGASISALDIDQVGGEATVSSLQAEGGHGMFIHCDVTQATDCQRAVQRTLDTLGGIEVLFNNAGIIRRANVIETTDEEWDRTLAVNLKSVFLMCKYTLPHMIQAGGGSVIVTASAAGLVGISRGVAYAASKAAVVNMCRAMTVDHGSQNIRFNCICPGDTDTPMIRGEARQLGISNEAFHASSLERRPLGRIGRPEEIAQAALYLASDDSSYMSGAYLLLDGGALAS